MKAGLLARGNWRRCRVAGGSGKDIYTQGGVNNTSAIANACAWCDMNFTIGQPQQGPGLPDGGREEILGIYIPAIHYTVISNGGQHRVGIFMCPESERNVPNLNYTSGQNGPPQTSLMNMRGTMLDCTGDNGETQVQGQPENTRRPIFIPKGFFVRCAEINSAGASDCCAMEFDYVLIYDSCADLSF